MSINTQRPVIKSALLRLREGHLILPRNLLVELVAIDMLEPAPLPGVLGWLAWRNRSIPVASLESLCLFDKVAPAHSGNCLILHTVSDHDELPFIAIQVQGGLQTIDINEDSMRDDHSGQIQQCPYIARQVRIARLVCFIPDLPAIEAVLAEMRH